MNATTTRTQAGDTVDLLCWQHYGFTKRATEAVLSANPGLADQGETLPSGLTVTLPEIARTSATAPTVNLWD